MRYPALLSILLLSGCGIDDARAGDPWLVADTTLASSLVPVPERYSGTRETFYLHGTMSVRAQPDDSGALVQVLSPGDPVVLGPKDADGWAPVIDAAGTLIGYLYRASDDVRRAPPAQEDADAPRAMSPGASRQYHRGPRGGCYTYSSSGRKRYVDHSYCG